MPAVLLEGQEAHQAGQWREARQRYTTFLKEQEHGSFSEGTAFLVAALPAPDDEPDKAFLKQIERLQRLHHDHPTSPYAPWALCMMGDLYWQAGWSSEAKGVFEEFLKTYPKHPLAGGVMIEAGRSYLENRQYLEAALIYRRVMEEPKWDAHRMKGALGLANATALSKAWKQAMYWFQVVEAECPELIRQSPEALLNYGETQRAKGQSAQARQQYLTAINLYPHSPESGKSLIRISDDLFQAGQDYPGLWFADQANQQFQGQEAGRRGRAALVRWVVSFLREGHSKEDWVQVYQRLDDLEVYLSMSWDYVLETSRLLSQAPEVDLAEESIMWMGHAYEQLGDREEAIQAFARLAVNGTVPAIREEGESRLHELLDASMQAFSRQQDWVSLLKFYTEHRQAFHLVPADREQVLQVAQAYQAVALPEQALKWYDQLLEEHPQLSFREEIMFRKIGLADALKHSERLQKFGSDYLHEFPQGKWRGTVSTLLGMDAVRGQQFDKAIAYFSAALDQLEDPEGKRFVLRQRAKAYHAMGKMDQAQRDIQTLVVGKSPHIHDVMQLGDVFFEQGNYAEAASLYQQVRDREVSPGLQAWATYRLGLSFERMGKYREGAVLLKSIRALDVKPPDVEHSIRLAAGAVLEEFSLQPKSWEGIDRGVTQP